MCIKEFLGYECGHCSVPYLRQCPLSASNPIYPICKWPAERPIFTNEMCHPCSRVLWNQNVLKEEGEHRERHLRGECECETIFQGEDREKHIRPRPRKGKGKDQEDYGHGDKYRPYSVRDRLGESRDKGDRDIGDRDTGDRDTGDRDTGDQDTGYYSNQAAGFSSGYEARHMIKGECDGHGYTINEPDSSVRQAVGQCGMSEGRHMDKGECDIDTPAPIEPCGYDREGSEETATDEYNISRYVEAGDVHNYQDWAAKSQQSNYEYAGYYIAPPLSQASQSTSPAGLTHAMSHQGQVTMGEPGASMKWYPDNNTYPTHPPGPTHQSSFHHTSFRGKNVRRGPRAMSEPIGDFDPPGSPEFVAKKPVCQPRVVSSNMVGF